MEAFDDGLLVANRLGAMWFVTSARELQPLSPRIPVNVEEFHNDPYNKTTDWREQFGVKDILIQRLASGIRLLASYNHWYPDKDCYVLRVSSVETTTPKSGAGPTHFEQIGGRYSKPRRAFPLRVKAAFTRPTKDAGGRLVAISDSEILLSVGRFGVDGGGGHRDRLFERPPKPLTTPTVKRSLSTSTTELPGFTRSDIATPKG